MAASFQRSRERSLDFNLNVVVVFREALYGVHARGLVFGFSQSIAFFAYATTMYYGGTLIIDDTVDYATVFK